MANNPEILGDFLHLRYKPNREYFSNCLEPPAFNHFDWVIWSPDDKLFQRKQVERPQTILCLASRESLEALLERKDRINGATLVVAGEDAHLSELLDIVDALAPHCKQILYEAKDIHHKQIRSFCMGFISYYINRFDHELVSRLMAASEGLPPKKHGVLAAWGAIWKHLDNTIEDRKAASLFIEKTTWLTRETLPPNLYMKRLAESKYLLAPAGNGIQAPKLAEAWLMRAVPIVVSNPCFEDLRDEGFPLLILKNWEDLTEALLEDFENQRQSINWKHVRHMLTLEYFLAKLDTNRDC